MPQAKQRSNAKSAGKALQQEEDDEEEAMCRHLTIARLAALRLRQTNWRCCKAHGEQMSSLQAKHRADGEEVCMLVPPVDAKC